jgi:hypothetical protein
MPQKFLDGTKVGATLEKVNGIRMAQSMRADPVRETRTLGVFLQNVISGLPEQF